MGKHHLSAIIFTDILKTFPIISAHAPTTLLKAGYILPILLALLMVTPSCDKSPTEEDADIVLQAQLTDDNIVNLSWTVLRHPVIGAWSCHLNRKTPADTSWLNIEEFFPDSDEYIYSDHLDSGSIYEYQVTASTLFEHYYSNIVTIEAH